MLWDKAAVEYSIIEEAFMWVSSDRPCMQTALVNKWYAFENARSRQALLEWCGRNGIDVDG